MSGRMGRTNMTSPPDTTAGIAYLSMGLAVGMSKPPWTAGIAGSKRTIFTIVEKRAQQGSRSADRSIEIYEETLYKRRNISSLPITVFYPYRR
jgi:hypothetical protein